MPNVIAINYTRPSDLPTACEIYRANMPLVYLHDKAGWGVRWVYIDDLTRDFQKRGRQVWLELISTFDLFLFPRAVAPTPQLRDMILSMVTLLRQFGKRLIYEVDDDFTNEHRDLRPIGIENAMEIASWMDAVTVTTPILAELMRKRTGRPTYVLPNCVDPKLWDRPEKRIAHDELVIGLSGSETHYEDWKILGQVLPQILEREYDIPVRLRLTAFHPPYLKDLKRTDYLPGFDYAGSAELVRSCDIVLAPVLPSDGFNMGKSPIKVIEGMAASRPLDDEIGGAFCIATRHPVYVLAIQHGKTGLLTEHTAEGWFKALDWAIRDHVMRRRVQIAAHRWVWRHHDISQRWRDWKRAYERILKRPPNTVKLPQVGV